jgi:anti-sigma regulatory factor (Ser/Thr protein kinase)
MRPDRAIPRKGRSRFVPEREQPEAELDGLRATNQRQTLVIDKLSDALSALRSDVSGLEVENADLSEQNARLRAQVAAISIADGGAPRDMVEAVLPLNVHAPAAARVVVADFLRERVAPRLFDSAQLIISELVSNSLRHNAAPFDQAVVIRVALERATWRLEVEDPGGTGVLPPEHERAAGGRLGLNLVQTLSECWGVEHAAERGTRAWAFLPRAPATIQHETTPARLSPEL